jgi:hypothetical protein
VLPARKSSPIRSALIIAHPGHELRVFGWYEQARPTTFVLTSGSRNGDNGRTSLSRDLACQTRSSIGSLFGRYLDRQIYEAILEREVSLFADWASELTDALVDLGPELVVVDGWQFYNVAHDLAHLMARLAVEHAGRQLGRNIELVEFDVAPRSLGEMPPEGPEAFRVELDDVAFSRKQTHANRPEIREEFMNVVALEGLPAQQTEVFRKPLELDTIMSSAPTVPLYERFGEERVAAGIYRECIRWHDHVRPVVDAIRGS